MQPSLPPPDHQDAAAVVSNGPSLEDVRALARLLRECGLSELSVGSADEAARAASLTLRRVPDSSHVAAVAAPVAAPKAPVAPVVAAPAAGVKRGAAATVSKAPGAASEPQSAAVVAAASAAEAASSGEILATAVGLFREAKAPLAIGDEVKRGQVVGFVESLKVPSEVCAPQSGRVSALLCEAGQGVEYGQVLMRLEPLPETEAPQGESS